MAYKELEQKSLYKSCQSAVINMKGTYGRYTAVYMHSVYIQYIHMYCM